MAHGNKPAAPISNLAASNPQLCAGPGPTKPSQETHIDLVKEVSAQSFCTIKDDNNDQLTAANRSFFRGEDMEDTCSEYDNVGSDVEQDYDEVLHLNRGGVTDTRYYKQYCPEDVAYLKHAGGKIVDESGSATPHQSTERCDGSQSETKPHKSGRPLPSRCTAIRREAAEGEEVGKGLENRFFFCDGDEIEEVLDGARFIEDLEDDSLDNNIPRQLGHNQDDDRIRKGFDERERENDRGVTRNKEDRQGKGRGRRTAGQDVGIKGCTTVKNDNRVKTSCKENKKAPMRTKAKSNSSKQHPPPRHSHGETPINSPKTETPPVTRPSVSTNNQDSEPRVIKPSLPLRHAPEQETRPLEESQTQPQTLQQDEKPSTAVMQVEVPEQPRRPMSPNVLPDEESGSPKTQESASFPSFEDVPGPCEPEDLIDGIIFAANYLGCTQVLSDKNPSKTVRMSQAHEAVSRIKSQDEESQIMTEVDLFISTKAVKVLNADTQETMMDSTLRTISYIADIGSIVVLMARRRLSQASSPEDFSESPDSSVEGSSQCGMICYVFESEDAQLIAQSIGQAFSVAYREFLRANGINPTDLSQKQYSDIINSQEMYHDDLVHFSNSDNCKELCVEKQKGENLGVVIVESGWGSILPTVILAGMMNSGPAARSGKLSVGDQIMSINNTSLVGLPLATCQGIIKGLKNQLKVKLSIVSCPPVTTVLIKRPDLKFQLGFSVQNGIICSLMRGGIAERGGVRVGHRIIEINGQSVVAMAHEKIVQTLSVSVGEIKMKTMPAVMFRLLTGQETPSYI
uniref:amyloid-beta A4 precursor protein-binding family A member 2-like isoform X2 n=1 Tax=Doryrhamphus excisus TaxID=161450 RepID=UPI0025AE9099|nr:amyloid-beta A4 precursor protein-binding family A member 2-like isoform X2 [Doryrhamphus excisus]